MAISINWGTKVVSVPKSFMTQLSPTLYELDLNEFRVALRDLEDSEAGVPFPMTHNHNTQVTLAGITFAHMLEIINGYTVTFEDGQYAVSAIGANSNIADVMNLNQVSLRTANSAGLITVSGGSGLSQAEHDELMSMQGGIRGADSDTLKTLSDQIDGIELGSGGLTQEEHDELMGIRGADDDTLKILSDQIDGKASQSSVDDIHTDLSGKSSQASVDDLHSDLAGKASQASVDDIHTDLAGKALQSTLLALGSVVTDISSTIANIYAIDQLLLAFIKNKKLLSKIGNVWYLIIKNDAGTADILKKELKDKDGNDITDIEAGILAQEMKSSV